MNDDLFDSNEASGPPTILAEAAAKRFNAQGEYVDLWKHPYRIDVSNPQSPNVYSFGENGIDEGGAEGSDDIASWR